jgi:predicted house-cleaning noncanonical NTP pyrophosphatase (MazG superfamily)
MRLVKLVRDRVGMFLGESTVHFEPVPQELMLPLLRRKLLEESTEYLMEPSIDELADVLEVVRCLANQEGWKWKEVVKLCNAKFHERGAFVTGMGLYIETNPERSQFG